MTEGPLNDLCIDIDDVVDGLVLAFQHQAIDLAIGGTTAAVGLANDSPSLWIGGVAYLLASYGNSLIPEHKSLIYEGARRVYGVLRNEIELWEPFYSETKMFARNLAVAVGRTIQ